MSDLWRPLGHDELASKIARALSETSEQPDLVVIEGPPGTGKSSLARGIASMWEAAGGSPVVTEGDLLHSDDALYPFGFVLTELPPAWKSYVPKLTGVARAGETLLGTAGLITATVETLARARSGRRQGRAWQLSDTEQDILDRLERLGRKQPLLIVADNLHWWDATSLEFLGRLRDPRMWDAFPFLAELRVLAVQTPEPYQHIAHQDAHAALLRPQATSLLKLQRIPRENFAEVLAELGAGTPPPEDLTDAVYRLSGGHLALAKRCADRIGRGEEDALLAAASSDEFLHRILVERISALGGVGREALAVLQTAAVLGLTFRRDELNCTSGGDAAEVARLLRACRAETLLELDDRIGRFVHEVYRHYFLGEGPLDRTSVHERLAACLQESRPGEYELRARTALEAERSGDAAVWAVHAALQRQRERLSWRDMPPPVMDAMRADGAVSIAETFEVALTQLNAYEFDACLQTLDGLPGDLASSLLAEADYLRASCLMATRSEECRAEARALLEGWAGYERDEPELGVRLMQLLLYVLAMLPDKAPARGLANQMRRLLAGRASVDPAAKDAQYTLGRCAGAIHVPERALRMVRDAVDHFAPADGQTLIRRPVEYYRCLVNLGAILILNAQYGEAQAVHRRMAAVIEGFAPGTFPRLDYTLMNALLAEHRAGLVAPAEAVRRQRQIAARHEVAGDPFYVENALAVFLGLAGSEEEALELFARLERRLALRRDPEPSMVYLIRANRAVLSFATGALDDAMAEWRRLEPLVGRIPYVTADVLKRRHELLGTVLDRGAGMTARELDDCLVVDRRPEYGPLWDHLGRGFWLPEIEWWR